MENTLHESRGEALKGFFILFFLVVVGGGVLLAFQTWKTVGKIEVLGVSAYTHLSHAAEEFVPENFTLAKQELEGAKHDIDEIVRLLGGVSYLRYVPFWSSRYESLYSFSRIVQQFIDTGVQLSSLVEHISEPIRATDGTITITRMSDEDKRVVLERTVQSIPRLQSMRATLQILGSTLRGISDDALEKVLVPIKSDLLAKGDYITYTIDQALPLLEVIPLFVGYNKEKEYLLLLQDPTELRPTGGLIEMYSLLRVKDAAILSLRSEKTYGDIRGSGFARLPALAEFTAQEIPGGFLQDTNWQSDFSKSAQHAVEAFRSAEGGDIDGVIGVTPEFFISLLRMTGDIRIGDTVWSSTRFIDELHGQLASGSPPLGKLTRAIIDAVNGMKFQKIYDVTKLVEARLNEKHILLWFSDPKLNEFAKSNNWTGEIRATGGDFMMITDGNVGSKKTDPFIQRTVTRDIVEDELDNLTVSLEILYRNNATITPSTDRYRDHIEVIVPEGSQLLRSVGFRKNDEGREEGQVDVRDAQGYTVFEGFTVVEPFQNQKIQLEYRLPKRLAKKILNKGTYSFFVQKQPGSMQNLTATFFFKKPVKSFTNGGFFTQKAGGAGVQFQTDLRVDREFHIQF
ncbi:DUF4012 domain-containing protein [Candidatus Uhrbacteria bacterium]|nr:DUF4012 domain-containing protein [Candidatus Uhrbacteria bacterium]